MPEQQKAPVQVQPQPQARKAEPSSPLFPAASSGDPAVQNLIAERETAERNGDTDAAVALTRRLADLGAV